MSKLSNNSLLRFLTNTTIYKAVAVCLLILTPAAPFCFVSQPISVVLLLWGAFILVADLMGERRFAKSAYSILLLGFIASYCITLLLFIENDIISTFNVFFWMIIEFFLLYAFFDFKNIKEVFNEIYKINLPVTVITTLCSVVSLALIIFRITVFMEDPEGLNKAWIFGVVGERSSGIFNNAIPFASCTFIGFVAALWNLVAVIFNKTSKGKKLSIGLYSAAILLNYICLQTTFTRSFVFSAYFAIGCAAFASLFLMLKDKKHLLIRIGAGLLAAAVLLVAMYGVFAASKTVIPLIANKNEAIYINFTDKSDKELIEEYDLSDEVTMDRTQYGEGFLGPRADIWRVILDVIPHSPVFGFTSGNRGSTSLEYDTSGYVEKGFPNIGIPTYHNAYIDILASAGFLGLAIILLFLALNIASTLKTLFSRKTSFENSSAIHYSLLAALCAAHIFVVCLFLGHLIFANISTCLYFWVCLGALARANELIRNKNKEKFKVSLITDKLFVRKNKKEA